MTPCPNCGSSDCVIKETYMTATLTLRNVFCLKCSTRGEFCKTEAEALAAWAMPAAREDERQKVLAEVRKYTHGLPHEAVYDLWAALKKFIERELKDGEK